MKISQVLADNVTATPTGVTWDSVVIPNGKRATIVTFAGSVTGGSVILKWGGAVVRAVCGGTIELSNFLSVIGNGTNKFSITRINDSGSPRIIASWIDIAVED